MNIVVVTIAAAAVVVFLVLGLSDAVFVVVVNLESI